MIVRKCRICGKRFLCYPSDKKVTCGRPECVLQNRCKSHKGVSNRWNPESRLKKSVQGQTANLRKGTPAAKDSPKSGRFETNINAQHWIVKSPNGEIYEFTNLMLWVRKHTTLFGKSADDNSVQQIAGGFYTAKRAIQGKKDQHTPTYMGWKIISFEK